MKKPRLGFLGTGWIGRHRMAAIVATGAAEPAAFCDPSDDCAAQALAAAPGARRVESLRDLLGLELDGIVIATPSAGHAGESIAALEHGVPVFCQKPLGRSEAEASAVVAAAREADRLLGVDFSYRGTAAAQAIKAEVESGRLGEIFAVDLVFHNAYGPDKPWFYDRALSGGGCVMDLGVHLIDLALWVLGFPEAETVEARLHAGGAVAQPDRVEDYAAAQIVLATGTTVRLTCSWRLNAGVEAQIGATFHGTRASAGFHNPGGDFYDFAAFRNVGTQREVLVVPPDDWGGRMAADWARQLAVDPCFDPAAERLVAVAGVVERIYRSGFSLGIDGRRYQSVEPFPHPAARVGDGVVGPQRQRRPAIV